MAVFALLALLVLSLRQAAINRDLRMRVLLLEAQFDAGMARRSSSHFGNGGRDV